jgi:hypothetical protein
MTKSRRKTADRGHSLDKLKEVVGSEKSDMSSPSPALHLTEPIVAKLESLAAAPTPLVVGQLQVLTEAGLNEKEIEALHFGNQRALESAAAERLKDLFSVLAQCFQLYGREAGLRWLHQPISRFGRRSPLQHLESTSDFDSVAEYLVQIAEGYFA